MVCIYCGSPTQVINSRQQWRTNGVWRRRLCTVCKNVFTTTEAPDLSTTVMVEPKPGSASLHHFNRDRLFLSIYDSCKHRPTALKDASSLTATVIGKLLGSQERPGVVTRDQIVATTHNC